LLAATKPYDASPLAIISIRSKSRFSVSLCSVSVDSSFFGSLKSKIITKQAEALTLAKVLCAQLFSARLFQWPIEFYENPALCGHSKTDDLKDKSILIVL
jgi:hypothetical protein